MQAQKNKTPYFAALAFFLAGVAYLIFAGFSESSMYFRDVSEALTMPKNELRATRLFGTVREGSIRLDKQGIRFQLEDQHDKSLTMWISYKGVVPDAFKDEAEVIVEGGFEPAHDDFMARTLMTKCPSKYEKDNRV